MNASVSQSETNGKMNPLSLYSAIGLSIVGIIIGLLMATGAADSGMAFHATIFTLFCLLWGGGVLLSAKRANTPSPFAEIDQGYSFFELLLEI